MNYIVTEAKSITSLNYIVASNYIVSKAEFIKEMFDNTIINVVVYMMCVNLNVI